jgi:hypothetical protein
VRHSANYGKDARDESGHSRPAPTRSKLNQEERIICDQCAIGDAVPFRSGFAPGPSPFASARKGAFIGARLSDLTGHKPFWGTETMTIHSRTNQVQAPESPKGKTVQQIDEALRDFVLQDTAHLRREAEDVTRGGLRPENAGQVVTDVHSLVQQVAGVSLDQLDDVIVDLRNLRDFLHREGVRVQREISGFLQLNQAAIGSTKFITDNIRQWKEGARGASPHSETESAGIAASSLPPPLS